MGQAVPSAKGKGVGRQPDSDIVQLHSEDGQHHGVMPQASQEEHGFLFVAVNIQP